MDSTPGELPGPQAGRLCEKCPLYIFFLKYIWETGRKHACNPKKQKQEGQEFKVTLGSNEMPSQRIKKKNRTGLIA